MTRYQIRKSIKVVGSREKLNHMMLQVAEMWEVSFLEGLTEHLKAGKSLEKFFIQDEPSAYPDMDNPEHLNVSKEAKGYSLNIGICFCGNAGEGCTFYFDEDGEYSDDRLPEMVMY